MRGLPSRGRCLASSITILLLSALPAAAQDGYACGYGKTPREAIADIANGYVLVSTHTQYHTGSGDEGYHGVTGVTGAVTLPREGIELWREGDGWVARVRTDQVSPVEGSWKEENITVNNTYNEAPTYSGGFRRERSTRVTTRTQVIRDPAGRVVEVNPGKTTRETTLRCWNGRYGYTYTKHSK